MKAIVTGGAGFIGSHIADRLIKDGHEVIIFDDLSAGKLENIPKKARFCQVDVSNWDELAANNNEFKGCDVIFHNAASKKNICLRDPVKDLQVNGGGTLMLLQLAQKYGVKKFVHASTGSVYGNVTAEINEGTRLMPVSYYGISKLAGESYVRHFRYAYGMNITILRYFHVYGERQETDADLGGVVAIFRDRIRNRLGITIHGDGEQQRVFTHVEDVVEANMIAWKQNRTYGQVYNCAASEKVTVGQLSDLLMDEYGEVEVEYTDPLEGDIFWFDVSSEKIQQLGVKFRPFKEGIKTML